MTKEESFLKNSYPIILTPDAGGYVVEIPDFAIGTQGDSIPEAMEMARDAIGLMGIDMEDDGKSLPIPSTLESVSKATSSRDINPLISAFPQKGARASWRPFYMAAWEP